MRPPALKAALCSARSKTSDGPDNYEDYSDYERHVDKATERKRADESQHPQYQEDDAYSQENSHLNLLL